MPVNYQQVIRDSRQELAQYIQQRDRVDQRITELCIALRALVRFIPEETHREQILQEVKAARRKQPSLADAILELLSKTKEPLNGPQIREQLELSGFDIEEYSQPLGAVMTAAQRLVEAGKLKKKATEESGVVFRLVATFEPPPGVKGNPAFYGE
ncbi:MAG TPA: hypothetical protein VJS37_01570 [Terriglobales bacterium]|nr:hypothetical protein [Terriglobales bacterium]